MASHSVRIEDGVKEEASRIAAEMGMTFNAVVNILLRKFNAEKGFPFAVRLETAREKGVFDLSSDEFCEACKKAVAERDADPRQDHFTRLDPETGRIIKEYEDGREEYVLDIQ